ncbi:MAG TPA: acetyl-CoA C-acyltransferase, partial [Gemmatimonadales bacterium]|nr:acetyl-CoA C-acyltransferase [Gemmatimonadales bacterium]
MPADAYISVALRTPVGRHGGSLANVRPDDLAAVPIKAVVERSGVDPASIDDVILGCANQAGEDNRNVARMALLLAGLPHTIPGETVNRLCASGMSAVASAARAISTGEGGLYIAGGVENMTRAPFVMAKSSKPWSREIDIYDTSLGWRFVNPRMRERYGVDSMGQTAENVAEKYGVVRGDQDCFALGSQQKAARARESGRFAQEIVPVTIPQRGGESKVVESDEFIKPRTTLEALAALKPAFRTDGTGSVTAGNSSGLNDGAAALLIASEEAIDKFHLK